MKVHRWTETEISLKNPLVYEYFGNEDCANIVWWSNIHLTFDDKFKINTQLKNGNYRIIFYAKIGSNVVVNWFLAILIITDSFLDFVFIETIMSNISFNNEPYQEAFDLHFTTVKKKKQEHFLKFISCLNNTYAANSNTWIRNLFQKWFSSSSV